MTKDQILKGVTLCVIARREDRPVGTYARVTQTGVLSIENKWWFQVDWLNYLPKRSSSSLRIWEDELPTFEIVTGPFTVPEYRHPSKRDGFTFKPAFPQLSFPFVDPFGQR